MPSDSVEETLFRGHKMLLDNYRRLGRNPTIPLVNRTFENLYDVLKEVERTHTEGHIMNEVRLMTGP
jgi:hypothetical protein